ncbi:MAG: PSD1 and planctomycete cytochrome C domain-containing protein, partial [Verrucomicrobiales bacterium]
MDGYSLDRLLLAATHLLTGLLASVSAADVRVLARGPEVVTAAPATAVVDSAEKLAFFEEKIRPLFISRCIECHGEEKQKGGLRLDSRAGWQKGGETGVAIVPGKPDESLLIKAVRYADKDLQMPPKKSLPPEEVAWLVEWIHQGAVDPRNDQPPAAQPATDEWAAEFQKRLDWWSLKPMQQPEPPTVADPAWNREPVDRFVRARLDEAGLPPAPRADAETLLRRLSFVLTGLPPSPELRSRFLNATQSDAAAALVALVDELLASPHYGERFARHWMDAVRYADTYGYEWDNPAKGSHEYRDYLIRAFNGDVGYDQLVREQIAGDLLDQPRVDADLQVNESLIGPVFYHLGEHRHESSLNFNGVHQEMVNNKIDAFSKVFLATTVACARCHDHKLEAVSQRDYFALGAVFITPRWTSRSVDAPGKNDAAIAKLKELRASIRSELAARWKAVSLQSADWRKLLTPAAPALEDIAYPLVKLTTAEGGVEAAWNALVKEWTEARAARTQANAAYSVLADFSQPELPAGWCSEGDGMAHGWVPEATPLVALEGEAVLARLLPRGYHTHALSSKLPGALRMPPQHVVPGQFTSLRLAGGEFAGHLTMDENTFQNERVGFLNNANPAWKSFADIPMKNGVTRVTVDFVTASLNSNFPPRTGLAAGLPAADSGFDKRSWLSITGIVTHEADGKPQDTLEAFGTLYTGPAPKTVEEANTRLTAWLTGAVQRWCEERTQPGDGPVLDWLLAHRLLPNKFGSGLPGATSSSLLLNENIGSAAGDVAQHFQGDGNPVNCAGGISGAGPTALAQGVGTLPVFDFNSSFADSKSRTTGQSPGNALVYRDRKFDSENPGPLILDTDNDGDFSDETVQTGFGMHGDAFITFDIDKIRQDNSVTADQAFLLTGQVGVAHFRPGQTLGANYANKSAAILVDGRVVQLFDFTDQAKDSPNAYHQFATTDNLLIPGAARFLTFAGLSGLGGQIGGAHLGFANMKLTAVPGDDADGDGLPSAWETHFVLDPNDNGSVNPTNGPAGDPDNDGLTNAQELARVTKPNDADTDDDGLTDGPEVTLGTSPRNADSDEDGLLDGDEVNVRRTNPLQPDSPLATLVAEYRRTEHSIAFARTANSMDERIAARAGLHFNARGNVDSLGELVMPDFLQLFAGRNDVAKSTGSGRRELAESLLQPEHPLTSRVYVNRVWHWVFGAGLVTTPDDFGRLGDKPSHPELLDWMAREFMRDGWSTRKLVRRLVLSETFLQSSVVTAAAREQDPGNRLRHHYSTRRLEAEGIRDALLAVSGRLDPTLYGRPIRPHRTAEDASKRLFSGPLDGEGRRSLYL